MKRLLYVKHAEDFFHPPHIDVFTRENGGQRARMYGRLREYVNLPDRVAVVTFDERAKKLGREKHRIPKYRGYGYTPLKVLTDVERDYGGKRSEKPLDAEVDYRKLSLALSDHSLAADGRAGHRLFNALVCSAPFFDIARARELEVRGQIVEAEQMPEEVLMPEGFPLYPEFREDAQRDFERCRVSPNFPLTYVPPGFTEPIICSVDISGTVLPPNVGNHELVLPQKPTLTGDPIADLFANVHYEGDLKFYQEMTARWQELHDRARKRNIGWTTQHETVEEMCAALPEGDHVYIMDVYPSVHEQFRSLIADDVETIEVHLH